MRLNLTLSQKGLLLVSIPLVCQILSVAVIAQMHNQAEREAAKSEHSKKISQSTNELVRDIFNIVVVTKGDEVTKNSFGSESYKTAVLNIRKQLDELSKLVQDQPERLAIVGSSTIAADRALALLEECEKAYDSGDNLTLMDALRRTRKELRYCIKGIISKELLQMAQENRAIEEAAPEKQARFRTVVQTTMFVTVAVNVVATLLLALFFSRNIISRLNILQDNSFRLASRRPLNPLLGGEDEIADVDRIFHTMADALQEAARKESAIIENAADVICSLDAKGTFVSISPACQRIFGFSQSDLVGSKFTRLFQTEDTDNALAQFQKACQGEFVAPFETRVKRGDDKIIDVLWSVHWSETEGSMFCVAHDITDRKAAERMKQEVVAMVSHDLRSPLATIRSFLEMLETGLFGEITERGQHLLSVANRNTSRMLTLIKDLLDIERMEAGMLELNITEVQMNKVFEHCDHAVQSLASAKSVTLDFQKSTITLAADEDRLVQVCTNLTTNAIKFSPKGSTVKATAREEKGLVIVSIADEGRGIPKELVPTIFDRFKQVEHADAKEKGGTGLGLTICKALVELHGGTISVESEFEKGSTFSFSIPKLPLAAEAGKNEKVASSGRASNQT
jgi:PAS domain S-box-containing protein